MKDIEKKLSLLMLENKRLAKENSRLSAQLNRVTSIDFADAGTRRGASKLWSGISHEILTPMDAILGLTELVLETELAEEQQESMEMIHVSAGRLFTILSDVIDYSDLQAGRLRRDISTFNIKEELEYDLYVADLSAKHKDIAIEIRYAEDVPQFINSDSTRLRQVLTTLLSYGVDVTESGKIFLYIENGGFDQNGNAMIRFEVVLPKNVLLEEKILPIGSEFFDDDEKYSYKKFGLAVAAQLVWLFNGDIAERNEKSGEKTLWFTWPVGNQALIEVDNTTVSTQFDNQDVSVLLKGCSLLLAEDEFINAAVTKAFLEQEGVEVTVVGNGEKAVRAAAKKKFDAILMDVQMPVMDGLEATRKIRKNEKKGTHHCPIIALTAHGLEGDRELCFQAGMDDFLQKPIDRDQLLDVLAGYVVHEALVVSADSARETAILQPLVERGWSVTLAETRSVAMYQASLIRFDLIIIDASFDVSEGCKFIEAVRQLEKFSGCRAVVIAFGDSDIKYRQSDCDCFYPENTALQMLAEKIETFQK